MRLTRIEVAALGVVLGFALYLTYLSATTTFRPSDFVIYRDAALGEYSDFFYAYWVLPPLRLLALLPETAQFLGFYLLSIGGVWLACRVWGGALALVWVSHVCLWMLWYGQYSGLMVGGVALLGWGIGSGRYRWAVIGALLALVKFHVALPLVLLLWWSAPRRGSMLKWLLVVVAGSLLVYGFWPLDILAALGGDSPPNAATSLTLWRWVGPACLVLWLPVLGLPLPPRRRLLAVAACSLLALPYVQLSDYLLLLVLPLPGGLGLLGSIGYLHALYPPLLLGLLALPGVVYVRVVGPPLVVYVGENTRQCIKWAKSLRPSNQIPNNWDYRNQDGTKPITPRRPYQHAEFDLLPPP